MSRKRELILLVLGILLGFTLAGPANAAVQQITATLSSQPIYVDGTQVSMTTYLIGGQNYVKLRDVGKAVEFNVYWDGGAVQIESGKPYTGKAPAVSTPQNSNSITEESVRAVLDTLKAQHPHGTTYSAPYRSTSGGPYGTTMSNCAGWAILCSDAAFRELPWRRVNRPDWNQIQVGDLVEYKNDKSYHVMVVTGKTDEYITTTDSNTLQRVYWSGQIFKCWLEQQPQYVLYTRYPQ